MTNTTTPLFDDPNDARSAAADMEVMGIAHADSSGVGRVPETAPETAHAPPTDMTGHEMGAVGSVTQGPPVEAGVGEADAEGEHAASDDAAPLSHALHIPTLADDPAPLSHLLHIPVLSKD